MKCPLRSGTRLLRGQAVEVLLVTIAGLKERLEVILLNLLSDELLQRLRLEELVGFLLRAQLDQKRLIDTLQSRHLSVLG
jgi:hypothetical protein